jgi:hypothetical protein
VERVEVDVGGGNVVESVACEESGVCSTRHVLSAAVACTDVRSISDERRRWRGSTNRIEWRGRRGINDPASFNPSARLSKLGTYVIIG